MINYWDDVCPTKFINSTIDFKHFSYVSSGFTNLTIFYNFTLDSNSYYSSSSLPLYNSTENNNTTVNWLSLYGTFTSSNDPLLEECTSNVQIPINETAAQILYQYPWMINVTLKAGFDLWWEIGSDQCDKCLNSRGVCGYNRTTTQFTCFYQNQPWPSTCPRPGKSKIKVQLSIGLAVAVTTIIGIIFIVLLVRLKLKSLSSLKALYFHLTSKNNERVEALLQYGSLAPKRFSYSAIKKITNTFKDKLGQGGYGSVYKGELPDGRIVAVKVLRKSKGDGQDFINEVASISRTSHVNIVTLLGFCYERSKRALIYEFMPNGSLDKFICNQGSLENHQLAIKTLYEIALGIGQGLEYLHRGCTTRILLFDIKPQNILLDANFCPKISDFGLAKLCETRDSIVSMTGARGTCGYIAPEVFRRNFGGVSNKCDVYSYGMVVLEMIGGRKNVNVEVSHTSEIYFPSWLYKQLEKSEKLNLDRIIADEEEEMTRKMIVVSLWCIQTIPSNRPSMSKVLEMLQGSLEALPLPLEPLFSSPAAISLQNSNTSSSVIMQGVPRTFEANSQLDDDNVSSNT